MRFLIVGLGSMGKRRIRNLRHLNAGEVIGYDPRADRREEVAARYGLRTFASIDDAMGAGPDAVIVSTPPDLHMPYAKMALEQGKPVFTEAGVVDDGMKEVIALARARKVLAAPSCTMRFHPSVKKIKELVDAQAAGRTLSFTYHSGQYLPDWHPWEDYRGYYVAKRATGACREIVPFELAWLTWALGDVHMVSCFKGKLSRLEVDIDDTYQLLLWFKPHVLGHLLVDVTARVPYRMFRLLADDGVIEWVWADKRVRLYDAVAGRWQDFAEPAGIAEQGYMAAEDMYIEEMRHFVEAIRGDRPYPYTLEQDRRILELLYAAERSADSGMHIRVD